MKQFADLHLRIPIDNLPQAEKMICKALELGYDLVGIPFPSYVNREKISEIEKICKDIGLDFATRVNLSPRNSNQLLHDLRKIRRKFEIVAVRCLTKDTARQIYVKDFLMNKKPNLHLRLFLLLKLNCPHYYS
jgi:RNase P/RNase MRP subunit p30